MTVEEKAEFEKNFVDKVEFERRLNDLRDKVRQDSQSSRNQFSIVLAAIAAVLGVLACFGITSMVQNGIVTGVEMGLNNAGSKATTQRIQELEVSAQASADHAKRAGDAADARLKDIFPPGTIIAYAGNIDHAHPPVGWLFCDGSSYPSEDFPDLYNVLHPAHPQSSNITTFKVPDLRGRFVIGANDAAVGSGLADGRGERKLASMGGRETITLTVPEMPMHSHTVVDNGHAHTLSGGGGLRAGSEGPMYPARSDAGGTLTTSMDKANITLMTAGESKAFDNMPPYQAQIYLIHYYSGISEGAGQ